MFKESVPLACLAIGLLVLPGCATDSTGPESANSGFGLTMRGVRFSSIPLYYSASFAGLNGKKKSPYQCTLIAKGADGRYKKANAWLSMPEPLKNPSGETEVVSYEWRPDGNNAPAAAAKCRIPKTPGAENYLLKRVLFIDPKTMRGGSSINGLYGNTQSGSITPRYDVYTLTAVTVVATPNSWLTGWSSNLTQSNQGFGASVPSWTNTDGEYGYIEPGQPCGGGAGIGVEPDSSFLMPTAEVTCPKTP